MDVNQITTGELYTIFQFPRNESIKKRMDKSQ